MALRWLAAWSGAHQRNSALLLAGAVGQAGSVSSEQISIQVSEQEMAIWKEAATRVRVAQAVIEQYGDPRPDSTLAQDDALCPDLHLSDASKGYLQAALDNLSLWADVVMPKVFVEGVINEGTPRPHFTLARAGLESAAQAAWVLESDERDVRIARHLRLAVADLDEMRRTTRHIDSQAEAAVKARISAIRESVDDEIKVAPAYLDMVRAAAPLGHLESNDAEVLWRTASAAAHGKLWFVEATQSTEIGEEFVAGYFRAVRTPDPGTLSPVVTLAVEVTDRALARLGVLLGEHMQQLFTTALDRVASDLPRAVTPKPD